MKWPLKTSLWVFFVFGALLAVSSFWAGDQTHLLVSGTRMLGIVCAALFALLSFVDVIMREKRRARVGAR